MPVQPHKRRARAGATLSLLVGGILCMLGLILLVLGSVRAGEQTIAPDRVAGKLVRPQATVQVQAVAMPSQPALAPGISAARARVLLEDMAPLRLPTHGSADTEVKSTLLCFCLHKGPETVRELRRMAAERFNQGLAAFAHAKYQEAADAFGQAMQRHPREARALVNRGLAYAHLGRYQEAKADLTQAIALHETLADAYYGRGLVAIVMGEHDGANADIRHAARLGDERALRLVPAGTQPLSAS